jgi:hypothetical protein
LKIERREDRYLSRIIAINNPNDRVDNRDPQDLIPFHAENLSG